MNKDNVIFTIIGILFGFISGYLMHEVMAARQPQRLVPGVSATPVGPASPVAGPAQPQLEEIARLRARLEQDPTDAEATLALANMNYDIRRWDGARDLYRRYLDLRPGDADVITDLGVCLRELGDLEGAMEQFRLAQELEPEHWQSRFNQVVLLAFDRGDLTGARSILDDLERLQPNNADVERLAGEVDRRIAES